MLVRCGEQVSKGSEANSIGLTLEGDHGPPRVKETMPGSLCALTEKIKPNMLVLSVNGVNVDGHLEATEIIKSSSGIVKFVLSEQQNYLMA